MLESVTFLGPEASGSRPAPASRWRRTNGIALERHNVEFAKGGLEAGVAEQDSGFSAAFLPEF